MGALPPQIVPAQQSPFEQAVIQAAQQAVKKPQHEPPKTSITISTPTPGTPGAAPPPLPKGPQFGAAPIPGSAPPPPAAAPTGPAANPDLLTQAAASEAAANAATQSGLALQAQPLPQPTPYQQPAMPKRNMGQDVGNVLGALLFKQASPQFVKQALGVDQQRDKQHAEDIAAAKETTATSQSAAQLAQTARNNELTRLQAMADQGDKHAQFLLKEYDHQIEIDNKRARAEAITRQGDVKLAQKATEIADNRVKFATTFSGTMANLGFKESKWSQQRADELAKQASLDTYRYNALGVRADNAFKIAQLRSATQFSIEAATIGDKDARANANNALRSSLAGDKEFQEGALATLRSIDSWTKTTMTLPPAQRAAAIAAMNKQLDDPNSQLGRFMDQMQRKGLLGESVGGSIDAEIRSALAGQAVTPGGGQTPSIDFHPTFNASPTATAPPTQAAPAAAAPTGKTITHAGILATAKEHGWTEADAIARAQAAGYTIAP